MNEKTLRVLEYNKILERLSTHTGNDAVKKRLLSLTPQTDKWKVADLQAQTTEGVDMILRLGNVPNLTIADTSSSVKRLRAGGVLLAREFLDISNLLKVCRNLKTYLDDGKAFELICEKATGLDSLRDVETRISSVVIGEDMIADDASGDLYSIRRSMRGYNDRIKDLLDGIIRSPKYQKYLQEPIVTMRGDRYCIPVRADSKGNVPGIVHDASASGQTIFVEPMAVVNANNELNALRAKEKTEIEKILAELSQYCAQYADILELDYNIVLDLDEIFARANFSISYNGTEPKLNNNGYINIIKGRHPLLDSAKVVPVDIMLGSDFDTLIITGPNTGGKTVTLKTVGLFVLMAQAGLHIPAWEGSEISVFNKIFADIGDEQSIEQSLSTFSAHMVNIVDILEHIDNDTLVLFDELGAGTDPIEGAALAMSIIEHSRDMGARVVATTHYSELKMYALSTEGVENGACEFDVKTLRPTYRLLIGVPGKSNAFAISRKLGLPDYVIDRAKSSLSDEDLKFEDVVTKLEKSRQIAEQEKEKIRQIKKESVSIKKSLEKESLELEKKRREIMDKARQEAAAIIADAQETAKEVVKEINKIAKDGADKKRIDEQRARLKKNFDKLAKGEEKPKRRGNVPKGLKPGNTVEILSLGTKATVLAPEDKNGDVMLQAGLMKIKSNVADLVLVVDDDAKKAVKSIMQQRSGSVLKTAQIKPELDVRGQNLEEALLMVDKYLDDCLMSSLGKVTIIHGKGTGILRNGIQDYLKHDRRVALYRNGLYGEGEMGVTVVELRK